MDVSQMILISNLVTQLCDALVGGKRDVYDVLGLIAAFGSLFVSAVGVLVTLWLVTVVQNGINNRRLIKDHFIKEVLEIRKDYLDLLRKLEEGEVSPKQVPYLFQQINIRVVDLMPILQREFNLVKDNISDYHVKVLGRVTEIREYTRKFKGNGKVFREAESKEQLQEIHGSSIGVFNSLIMQINDSA
jgi:hypothetical protein